MKELYRKRWAGSALSRIIFCLVFVSILLLAGCDDDDDWTPPSAEPAPAEEPRPELRSDFSLAEANEEVPSGWMEVLKMFFGGGPSPSPCIESEGLEEVAAWWDAWSPQPEYYTDLILDICIPAEYGEVAISLFTPDGRTIPLTVYETEPPQELIPLPLVEESSPDNTGDEGELPRVVGIVGDEPLVEVSPYRIYYRATYMPTLDDPPGDYMFLVEGILPDGDIYEELIHIPVPGPHLALLPEGAQLFGFEPHETVRLFAYELEETGNSYKFTAWQDFQVDENGQLLVTGDLMPVLAEGENSGAVQAYFQQAMFGPLFQ